MNTIGMVCAVTTFLGVWLGHVAVRWIEPRAVSIRLPAVGFAVCGLILEISALVSSTPAISAALGILGMTTLWDAVEINRQQKRVITGRAPANPANPRHARILSEHPAATMMRWLEREPLGRPLSTEEISAILEAAR